MVCISALTPNAAVRLLLRRPGTAGVFFEEKQNWILHVNPGQDAPSEES